MDLLIKKRIIKIKVEGRIKKLNLLVSYTKKMQLKQISNSFKNCLITFILLMTFFICSFVAVPVWGANSDTTNFNVEAVPTANQTAGISNYFDMAVVPNQEYPLKINIINNSEENQDFYVNVNQGGTSDSGAIDYSVEHPKLDKSLKYNIKEMVDKPSQKVMVPKQSSQEVLIKLKAPKEKFDGIILGGINVTKAKTAEKTDKNKQTKGIQLKNQIAYSIAIVLRSNSQTISSNMNLLEVKPGNDGAHPAILVRFQNSEAKILPSLNIKAKIHRKGEDKVLISSEKSDMKMAPNSNFTYTISYLDNPMKAGKYVIDIEAVSKADKWNWSEEFTITQKQAKTINKNSVFEEEKAQIPWLMIVLIILIILLLVLIIYVLYKKKSGSNDKKD